MQLKSKLFSCLYNDRSVWMTQTTMTMTRIRRGGSELGRSEGGKERQSARTQAAEARKTASQYLRGTRACRMTPRRAVPTWALTKKARGRYAYYQNRSNLRRTIDANFMSVVGTHNTPKHPTSQQRPHNAKYFTLRISRISRRRESTQSSCGSRITLFRFDADYAWRFHITIHDLYTTTLDHLFLQIHIFAESTFSFKETLSCRKIW